MTDRPIIFSAPMVRAFLDGRKTMTCRLAWGSEFDAGAMTVENDDCGPFSFERRLPDGARAHHVGPGRWDIKVFRPSPWQRVVPGDRLWVRETWARNWNQLSDTRMDRSLVFRADGGAPAKDNGSDLPWRSPIHMPRWASRLTLTVTAVKIERLQDISEEDARAEGMPNNHATKWPSGDPGEMGNVYRRNFVATWNALHGDGAWSTDPEVVCLSFVCHQQNIGCGAARATDTRVE